jgi:hypothetical protein
MAKLPDPHDFIVHDPFARTLRFYEASGNFYRRDETPANDVGDGGDVKPVSKMVYALRFLDECLAATEGD